MTADAPRHVPIRPSVLRTWGGLAITIALMAFGASLIVACTPPHESAPTPRPTLASIDGSVPVARRS